MACMQHGSLQQRSALRNALVAVLGDLDEVWADKELREVLLGLPVDGMELLLSSDRLQVRGQRARERHSVRECERV